jgi:CelD/BcsL family acetyltransferase involved in cellulose biosynthesis
MAVVGRIPDLAQQDLIVEAHDSTSWPKVAPAWSMLSAAAAHQSVFLTSESVETWLATFGAQLDPTVLLFRTDRGEVAGACIVVRRTERKGPFFVHRVYLNPSGEDDDDSPCIEYNALLAKPGCEISMARALRSYLDAHASCDELHAPGMLEGDSLCALRAVFHEMQVHDDVKPSYFVDLEALRTSGKDFVDTLPSRERTRYRQNVRKYSEIGELDLEVAHSTEEAESYLDALAVLHQKTWTSRGMPGSFASSPFYAYHRRLIRRCFPLGRIELLHLRAGTATIGYHYNFIFGGRSYFYQSGYDYDLGDKLSPGLMLHSFAIRHALEHGLVDYELMAGDVEYKRRLGTSMREMHWIRWQAATLKMKGFEFARHANRAIRDRFADKDATLRSRR